MKIIHIISPNYIMEASVILDKDAEASLYLK